MDKRVYAAIDLKSFYASVECHERGLDPLTTHLVVADVSRTEKTICLAVSPSLKEYGIPGRARLFEVNQAVNKINKERLKKAKSHKFIGTSFNKIELCNDPSLKLDFIKATPQMQHYINKSVEIYEIYLKYFSSEDIHVYSIDEVFIDITTYLKMYKCTAHELIKRVIQDVYKKSGITATAGIGTNLYLAKVAMDIVAKHVEADIDGVRIAELDEIKYRELLWDHTNLKDFWRVGHGYINRLNKLGLKSMGDIALCSIENEDRLYEEFGINAELLIDHAWGYEPVTIKDIKGYVPLNHSLSSGQVLSEPYDYEHIRIIVKEMTDLLSLDLVKKKIVTNQLVLSVGYDISSLNNYDGEIKKDWYGRNVPKSGHGSIALDFYTSSSDILREKMMELFDEIIDPNLLVRRVYVVANQIIKESDIGKYETYEQLSLFDDAQIIDKKNDESLKKEKKLQETIINIHNKYGKNSLLKGTNYQKGATTKERNKQIGGHKA